MTLRERLIALADGFRPSQRIAIAAARMALEDAARIVKVDEIDRLLDVQKHGGLTEHGEGSLATAKAIDEAIRALAASLANKETP